MFPIWRLPHSGLPVFAVKTSATSELNAKLDPWFSGPDRSAVDSRERPMSARSRSVPLSTSPGAGSRAVRVRPARFAENARCRSCIELPRLFVGTCRKPI